MRRWMESLYVVFPMLCSSTTFILSKREEVISMSSRRRRNKRRTDDEPEDQPEAVDLPEPPAYEVEDQEDEEDVLPIAAAEQTVQIKQYEFLQKVYDKSRTSWD